MAHGVEAWTDGSADNTSGIGAWGAVLVFGQHRKAISSPVQGKTTSQRCELTAAIEALKAIQRPIPVIVYSDSAYMVNGINYSQKKRANRDLWSQLEVQIGRMLGDVEFVKVKGHSDDELNTLAHDVAYAAYEAHRDNPAQQEDQEPQLIEEAEEHREESPDNVLDFEEAGRKLEDALWPEESLEMERKFGYRNARLYPFLCDRDRIGRLVETPLGSGRLHAVRGDEAQVLLESEMEEVKYKTGKPYRVLRLVKADEIKPRAGTVVSA